MSKTISVNNAEANRLKSRSTRDPWRLTLRTRSLPRRRKPTAFTAARIRSIRVRLNVSQPVFAELLYVTKDTAAKWEQGLRKPSGSALRLLEIAEKKPEVLVEP